MQVYYLCRIPVYFRLGNWGKWINLILEMDESRNGFSLRNWKIMLFNAAVAIDGYEECLAS